MDLQLCGNVPLYAEKPYHSRQFFLNLVSQLYEFFLHAFLPHKAVAVRMGFDLCPVDEYCRQTSKAPFR